MRASLGALEPAIDKKGWERGEAAINTLVGLILKLIQLLGIPVVCYELASFTLKGRGAEEPFYPCLAIALEALVIASVFSLVFGCVLDTLFVCCVRDKAEYKAAFMSDGLAGAFGFDRGGGADKGGGEEGGSDGEGGSCGDGDGGGGMGCGDGDGGGGDGGSAGGGGCGCGDAVCGDES